jgi:L-threonylcarbamoyladenylate synthase
LFGRRPARPRAIVKRICQISATEEELARAAELIRAGGLVAFPTETVYGLGANALDGEAVARIYEAKARPWASPLIVHVADEAMARTLTAEWPETAHRLAGRFWPGPLTIIVKKAPIVPDLVTAGLDSVGVRAPSHPIALDLIRRAGVPIAAPSANRFAETSPTTADHVRASLGERVDLILDGGPTQVGIESTVVSLRRSPPAILRPGMITQEELERLTGFEWEREIDLPHVSESPGLRPRHYAPRTPFYMLEPGAARPPGRGRTIAMPSDPQSYAAALYAELHAADKEGWDWIAVEKPPETPQWAGILDRLKRASTGVK